MLRNAGRQATVALAVVGALVLAGCSGSSQPASAPAAGPAVAFTSPEDGATVSSPVEVCMEAIDFTIEPSGEAKPDAGHLHVLIDPPAEELAEILAGEPVVIPDDATHVHMGDGSACTTLELASGSHALLAVVADGVHTNFSPPLTARLTLTVE